MEVCVIGYGVMGKGIAQLFAANGHHVHLMGYKLDKVKKAKKDIEKTLLSLAKKGRLKKKQVKSICKCIHPCVSLDVLKKSDLVIEAIPENLKLKRQLYKEKSKYCKKSTIIATNTSSISINELAKSVVYPERFLGLHFFNPAPVMELVEVIKGKKTSKTIITKATKILKTLNKSPVHCKDSPGFIVNRLVIPFLNDATILLDKKIATKEDIDKAVKLGLHHPMGPLELADFIGLDVVLDIYSVVKKTPPAPLLKKMVKQKRLGRKTGKGFYTYH